MGSGIFGSLRRWWVYAHLDLICQLHSGRNDRGLLRTTPITRISNGLGEYESVHKVESTEVHSQVGGYLG